MAGNKITEREQAQALKPDASVLITQKEMVDGSETEALRRAPMAALAAILHGLGISNGLALTEKSQPAVIWPEEGSLLRPVITMLPMQSGSGDPSPENPRPISGRTAVTVTRCGKNLVPFPYKNMDGYASKGITYTVNADGSVTANGTASEESFFYLFDYTVYLAPGVYNLSGVPAGNYGGTYRPQFYVRTRNSTLSPFSVYSEGRTFTVAEGDWFRVIIDITAGNVLENVTFRPMLVAWAEKADYEPYQGETFTLALGQTIYGGVLDAAKGELTVTHKLIAAANIGWKATATAGLFNSGSAPKAGATPLCNVLPCKSGAWTSSVGEWVIFNNQGVQWVIQTDLTSPDELTAWFAEHDAKVCYELKTPAAVQLSPAYIAAMEGRNIVFSSGEGMELTYNKSLVREHGELLARIAALENAVLNNA